MRKIVFGIWYGLLGIVAAIGVHRFVDKNITCAVIFTALFAASWLIGTNMCHKGLKEIEGKK